MIGVALLVAAFAAGGLLLSQTAYRDGLGAPLAVVTLANPMAAAVIGLVAPRRGPAGRRGGRPAGSGGRGLGVLGSGAAEPGPQVPLDAVDDEEHPVAAVLALEPSLRNRRPGPRSRDT